MPTSLLSLDADCLWLVTRALPPSSWPPWRATCVAARDAVRRAATAVRVDVSRDGDLPLPPLAAAAAAGLRRIELYTHKLRDEANPSLASTPALAALAAWIDGGGAPPAARVDVYVRCERAALDFALIIKLAAAGLLARATTTLTVRADGAHGLTLARDRFPPTAVAAGLAVAAEIKVGAPACRLVGTLAGWPLTRLTVLAAAPGGGSGPLGWAALRRAAATLTELHLCPGVPLWDALGRGDVVWPALTSLKIPAGEEGAAFWAAWPAAAVAPRLRVAAF